MADRFAQIGDRKGLIDFRRLAIDDGTSPAVGGGGGGVRVWSVRVKSDAHKEPFEYS
jgi:hypothetical protein